MYRYRRILVCLSLGEEDKTLIEYAGMVSRMARSVDVHFIHVLNPSDLPQEILDKQPILQKPKGSDAQMRIAEWVDRYFDAGLGVKMSCEVIQGVCPVVDVLRTGVKRDVDLIVVGSRSTSDEPAGFAKKIARKAPCSVLVVPDGSDAIISKVIVPIDFSAHSADAFEVAIALASASDLSEIYGEHIYRVPRECKLTERLQHEVEANLKDYAETAFKNFIGHQKLLKLSVTPIIRLADHTAKAIEEDVKKLHADLIVIGARGRSASAAVLLGSIAERLIGNTNVPLMAVKQKGEGMNVLEALIEWLK